MYFIPSVICGVAYATTKLFVAGERKVSPPAIRVHFVSATFAPTAEMELAPSIPTVQLKAMEYATQLRRQLEPPTCSP